MVTPFPVLPRAERLALRRLCARDADLAAIEPAAGPLPWRTRPVGFTGLLSAITAQQISNAAAAAIWRRIEALPGALDPVIFLRIPDEVLRTAGFSRQKIVYGRLLAEAFADGRLSAETLDTMTDEEAVAAISAIKGLGRWTAEVYLLFAHGRRDVFPAADLVLAAATADIKRLNARPPPKALLAMADEWRPWRGLAARLLWHHWRAITDRPSFDDMQPPPAR
jgi:DNA-3-methyladenine glycosylase II